MVKLNGSVPLPMDFMASAIYQDQPGPAIEAVYAATTAEALPSLGRNLAGGARTRQHAAGRAEHACSKAASDGWIFG